MSVTKLERNAQSKFVCPTCGQELKYVEGQAVQLVGGKADMDSILPKYECHHCGVFYRELLGSGFYDVFPLPKKPKKMLKTGDIPPTRLRREADGKCECPRCGERMDYVEGQAVRLVNGRPDMENVHEHFSCPYCKSIYRRIASTDYFQWSDH
jgi:predicted RNA-binding Zn-ribbon protein involved in translation (DUF1610 family)